MVVLVLCMPFTTFTQQNTERLDAVTAAKQDAKADVNQVL